MLLLRDLNALASVSDAEVRELIDRRINELAEDVDDVFELATFVVVEPGDDIDAIDAALGFPILANRFDGTQFGDANFTPPWEVLEEHAGCYELVYVVSDDGAGIELFVMKADGVPSELLSMCAAYAIPVKEGADT